MSMFREQIFLSPSVHSREDKKLFFFLRRKWIPLLEIWN